MKKKLPEIPEYIKMRHSDVILNILMMSQKDMRPADVWLFVLYLFRWLVRVCEIDFSHIPTHTRSSDPYVSSLSEKSVPYRYPCEISVTNTK